jgi:predicted phage tail protein
MSTSLTRPRRRARVVTIVWGAVLLAVAVLLLVGQFVALAIDPVIVALGLLVGVGLALVAGGILSLRTRPTPDDHDELPTY